MSAESLSAHDLWAKTVEQVKLRVNHRSLWESLEKTVGLAFDNGTIIVGMSTRYFNEAGQMQTSEHRNAIESTLSALAGRPITFRVIEGDTAADWAATQQRDARVAAMKSATFDKRDRESSSSQSWDAVYDLVTKKWSGLHGRQLPQIRSRYVKEMVEAMAEAMDNLQPSDSDEHAQRLIARVIDRIAGNVEVPSAVIAFEIDRARSDRD